VSSAGPAILEVEDLGFGYPVAARGPAPVRPFVLSGVSFAIAPGEILGVIGPNSAGKTTLIRLVTRLLAPSRGRILLEGEPLARVSAWEIARRVAVVPQEMPPALPLTVGDLVLMGRFPHGPGRYFESAEDHAIARRAMATTGVLGLAEVPLDTLGGGERQRAVIARALAQSPRLLVLDEPTAHLDLRYQIECASLLERLNRQCGVSILLVSHDLDLAAALCDRLLLLAGGRIARLGSPAEVLEPSLLTEVFGCPVGVEKSADGATVHARLAWPRRARRDGAGTVTPGERTGK
jgi:iron complex transport system ATP-binding protein